MEYQKILNVLDCKPNQPWQKIKTKKWDEINDEFRGTYNEDNQIRFKMPMLRSCLCDYSDVYTLIKGTITAANTAEAQGHPNNGANKK